MRDHGTPSGMAPAYMGSDPTTLRMDVGSSWVVAAFGC